jgi:hypothetical protein
MGTDVSDELRSAHRELTAKVMGRKGVTGTAIGPDGGRPCLKVYVSDPSAGSALPKTVGGHRVVVETTGTIKRL